MGYRYGEYSTTVSAVELWNKIKSKQKQLKICYLKIYTLIKLKQLSVIYIYIYMHLLVPKNIQTIYFSYEVHLLDYRLPQYLLSSDSKAMELHIERYIESYRII